MTNWHHHCWCQPLFLPLVGESLFAMFSVSKATSSFPPSSSPPASESSFVCNVPHFQTHWPTPPSFLPPVSESSFVTCHISKLTNPLLPSPSSSPLASESSFAVCHVSQAHQHAFPSFCPLASELSVTCHVSKLMNGLLPLPPPLLVHPHLQHAMFLSSPTHSSLFLPSSESSLAMCHVSELTNLLLPLSPLQEVSPRL